MIRLVLILVPWRARGPFRALLRRDPCAWCSARTGSTLDHIVPRSAGGPNAIDNLTAACPACNQAKGTLPLLLFLLAAGGELSAAAAK